MADLRDQVKWERVREELAAICAHEYLAGQAHLDVEQAAYLLAEEWMVDVQDTLASARQLEAAFRSLHIASRPAAGQSLDDK